MKAVRPRKRQTTQNRKGQKGQHHFFGAVLVQQATEGQLRERKTQKVAARQQAQVLRTEAELCGQRW